MTAVTEQSECDEATINNMAKMLDEAMGSRGETTEQVEAEKSGTEKYTPTTLPVGKCPFILTRAPNKGNCCSQKCKEGSKYCARHSKKSDVDEPAPAKTTKIVGKVAQSEVKPDKKPDFKFSVSKKFTPVAAKTTEQESSKPAPKIGVFTAKANARVPSLFAKKKANFYSRTFQPQDEDGETPEPMTLFFTDDELAKNMIFMDDGGVRTLMGFMNDELNVDEKDEPLPDDFMDNVDANVQETVTDEQREWCTKNKIAISTN